MTALAKYRRPKPLRRDWTDARAKVEAEGCCRACGPHEGLQRLEAAHTIGREFDEQVLCSECEGSGGLYGRLPELDGLCRQCGGSGKRATFWVNPDSIVPLCTECHRAYDAHQLDLLGKLTLDEELDAVRRAKGLENARVRLCPSAYSGQSRKIADGPENR